MVRKDDKAFKKVADKAMTDVYKSRPDQRDLRQVVPEADPAEGHQPQPADERRSSRRWSPSPPTRAIRRPTSKPTASQRTGNFGSPFSSLKCREARLDELQLELGHPAGSRAGRHGHLPPLPDRRPGLDARHRARRLGDRARDRLGGRHAAHHAAQVGGAARQRATSRSSATSRCIVQMFLWFFVRAGAAAAGARRLDQADAAALGLVPPGGAVPRPLHLGARRRAGARRHPVAAARPGHGRHRARPHARRRPTATCCCRRPSASSCRRSPPSS